MLFWSVYDNSKSEFVDMLPPSTYVLEYEDLDKGTYRSITSGNLIDTVISTKWTKISLTYNCLSASEVFDMMALINQNPIKVKAINPFYSGDNLVVDAMDMRVSRARAEMLENHDYKFSFNLVQKTKKAKQ